VVDELELTPIFDKEPKKRGVKKFHIPRSTVGGCPGVMRDAGPAPPTVHAVQNQFAKAISIGQWLVTVGQ